MSSTDNVTSTEGKPDQFLAAMEKTLEIIPRFMITDAQGRPYLERLKLAQREDGSSTTYLHVIYRSDDDRDGHDHPFDFESTIIWGSYIEQTFVRFCPKCDLRVEADRTSCPECFNLLRGIPSGKARKYLPGDVNSKVAHEVHRLTLNDGPVITLVKRSPQVRTWGFLTDDGWVDNITYLERKFGKGNLLTDYA